MPCGKNSTGEREKRARDKAAGLVAVDSRYVSGAKAIKAKAHALFEQIKGGQETKRENTDMGRAAPSTRLECKRPRIALAPNQASSQGYCR